MGSHKERALFAFLLQLKKHMERHKGVVEFAREELAKYQLPDSFSPPYTPRLAAGSYQLDYIHSSDSFMHITESQPGVH